MIGYVGVHRIDNGDIVNMLGCMVEEFADMDPRFSILFKFEGGGESDTSFSLCFQIDRKFLTVSFLQFWFVVERIDVGRPSIHEKMDNAFGFSGKVWRFGKQWIQCLVGGQSRCV